MAKYYVTSFFILKIILRNPDKNFGLLKTTIFIRAPPYCLFFILILFVRTIKNGIHLLLTYQYLQSCIDKIKMSIADKITTSLKEQNIAMKIPSPNAIQIGLQP